MPSLEVSGVGKCYPGFRLHPVSFSVEPGEVFAVLGLNGAGKSTLLRTIAGTVLPVRAPCPSAASSAVPAAQTPG